jgi:hypothetical protein
MSRYQPGRGRPIVASSQGVLPFSAACVVTPARLVSPRPLRWRLRGARLTAALRNLGGVLAALRPRDDFAGLDAHMLADIGVARSRIRHAQDLGVHAAVLRRAQVDPPGQGRPAR